MSGVNISQAHGQDSKRRYRDPDYEELDDALRPAPRNLRKDTDVPRPNF